MSGDGTAAIALAVVLAAIYMVVLRFIDLNEAEPIWALCVFGGFGAVTGLIVTATVSTLVLEVDVFWGALAKELAVFASIVFGAGVLAGVRQWRGWSEIHGPLDGVIYGAAAGLGYSVGQVFIRELLIEGGLAEVIHTNPSSRIWMQALAGLAFGLFGGAVGAGVGAAVRTPRNELKVFYPLVGLSAAVALHTLYNVLGGPGGSGSMLNTWVALGTPAAIVIITIIVSLRQESSVITTELADESPEIVTEQDRRLLVSTTARRHAYLSAFASGKFDEWLTLRTIHNRQVQLALAKSQLRAERDEADRPAIETEITHLRAAIAGLRREVVRGGTL